MENTSGQKTKKIGISDILLESLKRSGCCGSDLLQDVETNISNQSISKGQEILILTLVPSFVLVLILTSFFLERQGAKGIEFARYIALMAIFLGGGNRFMRGFQDLFIKRKVTIDVFVTISLLATMAIGEFLSAAIVIFIMAIAGAVEFYALDKSRKGIEDLLDLTSPIARLIGDNGEEEVHIDYIKIGDKVLVRPGETVVVDGLVVEGSAYVNEAAITGEAIAKHKNLGSRIYAGTLNETGRLLVEATKVGADTTLSKIVERVEKSQKVKAPIQKMADRFTTWYLPIVLIATFIGYLITRNVQSAVSILLVAAPCALSIGTPTAVTAGMTNMSKRGVLIKGGLYFEETGKLDAIFLDKTGTITSGKLTVVKIIPDAQIDQKEILSLAGSAEKYSDHPLAKPVLSIAIARGIPLEGPKEFSSETGRGVRAIVKGASIYVGRLDYMRENDFAI
ncbi:MAG TPA: cation-translocating P-type ATPase, partial [Epulopiscium sp.]|nr:cation-translocating P-type ATPase [Candidatus Epulonipiscium sp.]